MSPLAVLACNFENNPGPGLQVIYRSETKTTKKCEHFNLLKVYLCADEKGIELQNIISTSLRYLNQGTRHILFMQTSIKYGLLICPIQKMTSRRLTLACWHVTTSLINKSAD